MANIAASLLAGALLLAATPARPAEPPPGPLRVVVSIAPQKYFVERIGGSRVRAEALVGPGQNPHTFDLTPRQVARLAEADLYVRVGMPFEAGLLGKVAGMRRDLPIVDQREGIALRRMEEHGAEDADHGGEGTDPHVWMSPRLAKVQAAVIARALAAADPAHRAEYEANLEGFRADLDRVDRSVAAALAGLPRREFYIFHPVLGYFADAYGLTQTAVEAEGKEPGPRRLAALMDRARAEGVKVIFVQPQFSAKSAEAVARAIGGAVVPLDDLAEDYLANLERVAAALAGALGNGKQ